MKLRVVGLLSCVLLVSGLAACGGDDVTPPPPDVDAGETDAGPRDASADAGHVDAAACLDEDGDGHEAASCGGDDCDDTDPTRYPGATEICDLDDEDCNDATFGADADGDGYESSACCNGPGNCGTDCNDALNTVNPGAAEVCNGGIDDDCDGLGDAAEGVCTACPVGFEGMGTDCTDIDECATGGYCGSGATSCTNTVGSFACTCGAGYFVASAIGALCENVNECAAATNPCGAGSCTDNAGSYACSCPAGYRLVSSPSITCVDIDECAEGTDQCIVAPPAALCANTPGSYTCTCPTGYEGSGRIGTSCTNVDECARGLDDCNANAACADTVGSFTCTCTAGFAGAGHGAGGCADVDECATSPQCGRTLAGGAVNGCANATGGYVCSCGAGFVASGSGLSATCVNLDECATSVAQCGRTLGGGGVNGCTDTSGGYTCACGAGFAASGSGLAATWLERREAGVDLGLVRLTEREERLEAERGRVRVPHLLDLALEHDAPQRRQVGALLVDLAPLRGVLDDADLRVAVADDVGGLLGGARGVDPSGDAARHHRAQVGHEPGDAVLAEHGHGITGGEALGEQRAREGPAARGVGRPAQRTKVARGITGVDCGGVGPLAGVAQQAVNDGVSGVGAHVPSQCVPACDRAGFNQNATAARRLDTRRGRGDPRALFSSWERSTVHTEADTLRRKLYRRMGTTLRDYDLIRDGDKVMVCLSGGKDSYTLFDLLVEHQRRSPVRYELIGVHLDQGQPGYDGAPLAEWLRAFGAPPSKPRLRRPPRPCFFDITFLLTQKQDLWSPINLSGRNRHGAQPPRWCKVTG